MKKVILSIVVLSTLSVAEETRSLQDGVDKLFKQGKYAPTAQEIQKEKEEKARQPKNEKKSLQSWIDNALGQSKDAKKDVAKKPVKNDPSKTALQNWVDNTINN